MTLEDRVATLTGAGSAIGRGGGGIMALMFAAPVHRILAKTERYG